MGKKIKSNFSNLSPLPTKRNVNVERCHLFTRRQRWEESMDQYLTDLKVLASTCQLGDLEDSLLITVIIIGVHNSVLRERLLSTEQLTLAKCIQMCRANEVVKANRAELELKETQDTNPVNKIKKQSKQRGRKAKDNNECKQQAPARSEQRKQYDTSRGEQRKQYGTSKGDQRKNNDTPRREQHRQDNNERQTHNTDCWFCGRHHKRDKFLCPAYGKQCKKCGYYNHFAEVCKQQQRNVVQIEQVSPESDQDYEDVRKVVKVDRVSKSIKAKMLLGGSREWQQEVPFEVDCGASCDILLQHYLTNIQHKIEATKTVLKMYDGNLVTPIGKTTLKVTNPRNNSKYLVGFEIVRDGKYVPILGRKSSEKMGLI